MKKGQLVKANIGVEDNFFIDAEIVNIRVREVGKDDEWVLDEVSPPPSTPILGAEEVLRGIMDDDRTISSIVTAMQTFAAQYREECERLREENEELKTFIKTNLQ